MGATEFFRLDGPLDSMPAGRQMRVANLSGFATLVRHRGADPRAMLERHDIDPLVIRDPDNFVDSKSVVDLLEYCSRSLNDSLFGLQLAQQQDADVFGCVAALCRAASTVRESIDCFMTYLPVAHSPVALMELVEGEHTSELRWHVTTDLGNNNQANYQAVLLKMKLLRLVGGPNFRPSYINLATDTHDKDTSVLESTLGCRVNRTRSDNALAFPTAFLFQSVPSSSRLLFKLLGGYLDRVKAESRTSVPERVQDYVRGALASGNCSIERCAQKLNLSVRTLQVHLSEAGLHFSDILERQRLELAKNYLSEDLLSLDEVAAQLGYSEQSSFGRAFKRWTGVSPKLFREQALRMRAH
jgi:AraC-like DNA-binding protein